MAGHLDTTAYNNQVANAASQVKISSTVFKAFIADVKAKVDSNYDEAHTDYLYSIGVLRQSIINGGFAVNQRVKSGTVTLAAGAYGHDRWKAGSGGCTYTFATVNNVTTITITAGSLVQVIEGINLFSGTYILSWTGTAQGKIGAGAYSASGITGTATGGTNLSIEFNTGTLSNVQFNAGDQALPFQPRSFAEELALCQRYYEKTHNLNETPGVVGSTKLVTFIAFNASDANGNAMFSVRKRVPPTMTLYNFATAGSVDNYSIGTVSGVTAGGVGESGFATINKTAGWTTGNHLRFGYTADAEI